MQRGTHGIAWHIRSGTADRPRCRYSASAGRRTAVNGLAPHGHEQGVVLFTGSRREIEDLAAKVRRLRPDAEILIRPPVGTAYRYQ